MWRRLKVSGGCGSRDGVSLRLTSQLQHAHTKSIYPNPRPTRNNNNKLKKDEQPDGDQEVNANCWRCVAETEVWGPLFTLAFCALIGGEARGWHSVRPTAGELTMDVCEVVDGISNLLIELWISLGPN